MSSLGWYYQNARLRSARKGHAIYRLVCYLFSLSCLPVVVFNYPHYIHVIITYSSVLCRFYTISNIITWPLDANEIILRSTLHSAIYNFVYFTRCFYQMLAFLWCYYMLYYDQRTKTHFSAHLEAAEMLSAHNAHNFSLSF